MPVALHIDTVGGSNFAGHNLRNVGTLHVGGSALADTANLGELQVTGKAYSSAGFRLPNNVTFQGRNAAGSAWIDAWKINVAGQFEVLPTTLLPSNEAIRLTHAAGYIAFVPGGTTRVGYLQQSSTEVLMATDGTNNFRLALGGRLLVNTTITTGSIVGDVVLTWGKSLRHVNSANTSAYGLIGTETLSGSDVMRLGNANYPIILGGHNVFTGSSGGDLVVQSDRSIRFGNAAGTGVNNALSQDGSNHLRIGHSAGAIALGAAASKSGVFGSGPNGGVVIDFAQYLWSIDEAGTAARFIIGMSGSNIIRINAGHNAAASAPAFTATHYMSLRAADNTIVYVPCRLATW